MHKKKRKCPHCGAYYSDVSKPVEKRVKPKTWLGFMHRTFIKNLLIYVLWCLIFAGGWCCIMYFVMDVTFEEQWLVYVILWAFWIIWLIFFVLGKIGGVAKARLASSSPKGIVKCCMCGTEALKEQNYCSHCGTVLFINHSDSDVVVKSAKTKTKK